VRLSAAGGRYERTIRGNRGLIMKTFGVLLFMIVVYGKSIP